MSQTVKLSDELVDDAREKAAVAGRTIPEQIEFWARRGRSVESYISSDMPLVQSRTDCLPSLSTMIATVDSPEGHKRVENFLATQPFPHYEAAENQAGLLVRIGENGKRTLGKFVHGEFRTLLSESG